MKHGVLTIFRKELARFFGDKRMAFTTILLPGLLIFFLYSFMGTALTDQFTVDEDYTPVIHAVDLPDSIAALAEQANIVFDEVSAAEAEEIKALISSKEADVLAVFPFDFESAITAYTPGTGTAPAVALYYNSADVESQTAYSTMFSLLDSYESALTNRFDVNPGSGYDLATKEDTAGTIFASMLPKQGDKVMGFEMTGAMMDMMGGFTLLRLTAMIGTMNINFTKEQLLDMNAKLNQIKQP